jgi:hypothetical protein
VKVQSTLLWKYNNPMQYCFVCVVLKVMESNGPMVTNGMMRCDLVTLKFTCLHILYY